MYLQILRLGLQLTNFVHLLQTLAADKKQQPLQSKAVCWLSRKSLTFSNIQGV